MATCMNAFLFRFCCFVFFYSALVFRLIPSSSSGLRGSACNQKSNTTIEDFFFVCLTSSFEHSISQTQHKHKSQIFKLVCMVEVLEVCLIYYTSVASNTHSKA